MNDIFGFPVKATRRRSDNNVFSTPFNATKIRPIKLGGFASGSNYYGGGKKPKRTLGIRDKEILYDRAKHRCESCGKKIEFSEMQAGHNKASSKGGTITVKTAKCLCYACNKKQGTDSWSTFMRKKGTPIAKPKSRRKKSIRKSKPKNYESNTIFGNSNLSGIFR